MGLQEQQSHLAVIVPPNNPGQSTPMEIEELSDSEGLYGDAGQSAEGSMPQAAAAAPVDASEGCECLGLLSVTPVVPLRCCMHS